MSMTANLQVQSREGTGKGAARKLRASGRIPAVVYGREQEPIHLSMDAAEAMHLFQTISVDNTIISLQIEGEKEPIETLIREIQTHPYRPDLVHVDFLAIQRGVELEVEIPVHLEGTPQGVKFSGGVLDQVIHDIRVACVPALIPDEILIDVSGLDVGDSIHVRDIPVQEGVEILIDLDRTVATVVLPRQEVEEEEDEELEPELIGEDGEPIEEDREEGAADAEEESEEG